MKEEVFSSPFFTGPGGGVLTRICLHYKGGTVTYTDDPTIIFNKRGGGAFGLRKKIILGDATFWLDDRGGDDDLVATAIGEDAAVHMYEECCW